MTFKLSCTISHKSFDEPILKEFYYTADTLADIVEQIDTLPFHRANLLAHKRTAFKSTDGVKHQWQLTHMPEMN